MIIALLARRAGLTAGCTICGARPAASDAYCWNCGGRAYVVEEITGSRRECPPSTSPHRSGGARTRKEVTEVAMEGCDIHLVPSAASAAPDRYYLAAVVMGPERFYIAETSPEFGLPGASDDWERDPAFVHARAALAARLIKDGWQSLPPASSPYGVTLPRFCRAPRGR